MPSWKRGFNSTAGAGAGGAGFCPAGAGDNGGFCPGVTGAGAGVGFGAAGAAGACAYAAPEAMSALNVRTETTLMNRLCRWRREARSLVQSAVLSAGRLSEPPNTNELQCNTLITLGPFDN